MNKSSQSVEDFVDNADDYDILLRVEG